MASAFQLMPAPVQADMLLSQRFHSEALGRDMAYSIYLPPGWQTSGDAQYPVVFLLHGIGGNERDWPNLGHVEATLDRLIEAKAIAPLVAVMPAAGDSWYLDTAAFEGPGDYATAITKDLRRHVETSYRVADDATQRAIIGLSMGGFGSLRLGFEQAAEFAAIGSYSPTLFWQFGQITRVTRREDNELVQEFGDKAPDDFFRDHSPYAHLANYLNVETKPVVFLAAGDDDLLATPAYVVQLQEVLTAMGHRPEWRIYNGGHDWSVWRKAFEENIRLIGGTLWKARSAAGVDQAE